MADKTKTKAHEMAAKQKEISIAEFFSKNRHLLGFDPKVGLEEGLRMTVELDPQFQFK